MQRCQRPALDGTILLGNWNSCSFQKLQRFVSSNLDDSLLPLITLFVLGMKRRHNFSENKVALALKEHGQCQMEENAHMPMTWKGTTNGYPTFF